MAKTYRLGIAGMVHDHVWGEMKHWAKCPQVKVVAAADPNEPLRQRMAKEYGVKALYADWREMLAKEQLDLLQVTVENSAGADVVEAAAPKGIHIVTEKPMAATLAQADRMLKAAEKAGVELLVNWPLAWRPNVLKAHELVKSGAIGQVFLMRVRMAHRGPKEIGCSPYFWGWLYDAQKNGAGALMDYCCYGAMFCCYVLGAPNAVTGVAARLVKDYITVDDNALITMLYDKAFGIAEASWTQIPGYHDIEILGSEGTLVTDSGKLWLAKEDRKPRQEVSCPPLPAGETSAPEYLLKCLEAGKHVDGMCSARVGRDAQEILEAGLRSAQSGKLVTLPVKP